MASTWMKTISKAVQREDGAAVAEQMHDLASVGKVQWVNEIKSIETLCALKLPEAWVDVAAYHLYTVVAFSNDSFGEASECLQKSLDAFARLYRSEDSNWAQPVLEKLVIQVRKTAQVADKQLEAQNKKPKHMAKAGEVFTALFSKCNQDKRDPVSSSRRYSVLFIIVNLFKLYFRMKNLRLCRTFISQVENGSTPGLEEFPLSQVTTYHYYVGRYNMLQGDLKDADTHLSLALGYCHKRSVNNKRMILMYLVPVKMLLGKYPSRALLEKYSMSEYVELTLAVHSGDVMGVEACLDQNEEVFRRYGVLMTLEKLQMTTYRNLFKSVYTILDSTRISLKVLLPVVCKLGQEMEMDELECILANLIQSGKIKGYLAHDKSYLVLSKSGAFP